MASASKTNVLIVDLNNFSCFPTLAVGLLIATLRRAHHHVDLISPLANDVPAAEREYRETLLDHAKRRIHLTDFEPALKLRDVLRRMRTNAIERAHPRVLEQIDAALSTPPDIILLSAYLQHRPSVEAIAKRAQAAGVPVLLGGPMFNLDSVAQAWNDIPGVSAIVGAEVDRDLPQLVETLCAGGDISGMSGVLMPKAVRKVPAAPLRNLDDTPLPDFTDFPWDRYGTQIVPMMTGRGCQWDKCLFCSDVISASGRTFRTRSVASVIDEMRQQSERHDTGNFLFLDLKLNSWPDMMRGIAQQVRQHVPNAQWVGTVHVDTRSDNGLARADLDQAVESGMKRVSFGLETGSQTLLDAMNKGSDVAQNAQFIKDAHGAGLSVRCTMFKGFPGETAADMSATADFLESHAEMLDRVRFNDFTLHVGTPIWTQTVEQAADTGLKVLGTQNARGRVSYRYREPRTREYRRAKARALRVVHQINSCDLKDGAQQFDGVM